MWGEFKEMIDATLTPEARQRVERRVALGRLLEVKPPEPGDVLQPPDLQETFQRRNRT
jgi:hypothetical protein